MSSGLVTGSSCFRVGGSYAPATWRTSRKKPRPFSSRSIRIASDSKPRSKRAVSSSLLTAVGSLSKEPRPSTTRFVTRSSKRKLRSAAWLPVVASWPSSSREKGTRRDGNSLRYRLPELCGEEGRTRPGKKGGVQGRTANGVRTGPGWTCQDPPVVFHLRAVRDRTRDGPHRRRSEPNRWCGHC